MQRKWVAAHRLPLGASILGMPPSIGHILRSKYAKRANGLIRLRSKLENRMCSRRLLFVALAEQACEAGVRATHVAVALEGWTSMTKDEVTRERHFFRLDSAVWKIPEPVTSS